MSVIFEQPDPTDGITLEALHPCNPKDANSATAAALPSLSSSRRVNFPIVSNLDALSHASDGAATTRLENFLGKPLGRHKNTAAPESQTPATPTPLNGSLLAFPFFDSHFRESKEEIVTCDAAASWAVHSPWVDAPASFPPCSP